MNEEKLTVETCQRMQTEDDPPDSYDSSECQDCTNWDCIFMPGSAYDDFMRGELETMFPEGVDDGFNSSDFGEN
jgi:hypothetical protein